MARRALGLACASVCLLAASALHARAQGTATSAATLRVEERIRALQLEADQLAGRARTLVGELRTLEIARDLRVAEATRAEAAVEEASHALAATSDRLATLERQRVDQLPALRAQLVDLYKRGEGGNLALLLRAADVRDLSRASRALAAMADRNRRRIETHRQTLTALARERATLEQRSRELEKDQAAALHARATAERAVKAHAVRITEVDARRDLTAQYMGELQAARDGLLRQLADRQDEGAPLATGVPLTPFRGALAWPVDGTLVGRFGQSANRLGGTAVRDGVEISAPAGTPVRAVHGGTVAHSDPFTGLGTLVIIDHGAGQYSLYGYLGATSVTAGQPIDAGAELGQVGNSPAGPAALYLEIRIDGRSVDPVQWLQSR